MKALAVLLVILLCGVAMGQQQHAVQDENGIASLTYSRNYGSATQGTGWRTATSGSLAAYSTNKTGTYTFTAPTQSSAYTLYWGYADGSTGSGFVAQKWAMSKPLPSTGQPYQRSPRGNILPDGSMVDENGVPVDPNTGESDPNGEHQPRAQITLTNPWENRPGYFEIDFHDENGNLQGTEGYTLFPGETKILTWTRPRPFSATPFLLVDGNRQQWGRPVHSSGGSTGGSSQPPVLAQPPVTIVTPPSVVAETAGTSEVKVAIDRLAKIINQQTAANAQNATLMNQSLSEINESIEGVQGVVNGVNATLQAGISVTGTGGGSGLTQAELDSSLDAALGNDNVPSGIGDSLSDPGVDGAIAEGQAAAGNIPGIRTSIAGIGTKLSELADSLGLDGSYASSELVWNISLPVFGSLTINAETHAWLWDLLRQVTLWCFALYMVPRFINAVKFAIPG